MERVLGLGGYFMRAADPAALGAWYREGSVASNVVAPALMPDNLDCRPIARLADGVVDREDLPCPSRPGPFESWAS
jgi:hypothetical protein